MLLLSVPGVQEQHCKTLSHSVKLPAPRTPVYMSPEVLMKSKDRQGYDGRSVDVWASGILLFVMLMVRRGWEGGGVGIPTPGGAHCVM